MTKTSNTSMIEAGRIVNEINNLKIQLHEILDFYEEADDFYYALRDYVNFIDKAEPKLLSNIALPYCEWATETNPSD